MQRPGVRDLRRQALESGKTVSRKKRNKEDFRSRDSSAGNSRTNSRNVSRQGSDIDEDEDNLSVGTDLSMASFDEDLFSGGSDDLEEDDDTPEEWKSRLKERVEEITDRKRSSVQGREATLSGYSQILRSHFSLQEIKPRTPELVSAMLKSIKNETSELETCLALKALEITVMTLQSETIYDAVFQTLKRSYKDSESIAIKAAAIHALGTIAVYGGASTEECSEIMDELLEVIESDGNSIEAGDSVEVVVAALQEWGHLAVDSDDLEDKTEEAIEVFVEQLESTYTSVQIAAGQNIALLFEKSYGEIDSDTEFPSDDEMDDDHHQSRIQELKQYDAYRDRNQLIHTLTQLVKESSKSTSKKERASMRSGLREVLQTVEDPTHGPGYRSHFGRGGHKALGSGIVVRIYQKGHLIIDRWWKLQRLQALKRVLGGGFLMHYEENEMIFDSLPIMIDGAPRVKADRLRKA